MKYTIDAKNKKLGRVASAAAKALLGKNSPSWQANVAADVQVEVSGASKLDINARKSSSKVYVTYTGHRGGLNKETLGRLIDRRGAAEALRRAIYRMLPNNKLRDIRMKNLKITN